MRYELISPINRLYTVIEQILTNRGLKYTDIYHYLHTTDQDILNPELLDNINEGAIMLVNHIYKNNNILVLFDVDCDGYTSSAILINYLYRLFPAFVENHIYYTTNQGKVHGILSDTIPDNISLVIAPDSSSESYDEHQILKQKGIDTLILDHHLAKYVSPNACVINNQLCDYPTKSLSGAAIVWKFCSYIDNLLKTSYANDFLDLVSLGLIADVMNLQDFETKHLVHKGIAQIKNPLLAKMIERDSFHFQDEITPTDIAFYIAPLINATTRVGTMEEKIMLFESMLEYKAYNIIPSTKRGCKGETETLVSQACRNCTNIKNRQTKSRDNTLELIKELINSNNLLANKILIIQLEGSNTNRDLTGLIANQLMGEYQKPVLVLNQVISSQDEIFWEGSGRGYDKSDLKDFRGFIEDSGFAEFAQGHPNAFGVSFKNENLEPFINYSNQKLENLDFSPIYNVDFIYHINDIVPEDILDVAELKILWGKGIEEPYIALEGIKITKDKVTLMSKDKNPTLKIQLSNNISLIKFKSSEKEYESLYSESGYVAINIVGKCERNIWNNNINPQIIIVDYEIVDRATYYF